MADQGQKYRASRSIHPRHWRELRTWVKVVKVKSKVAGTVCALTWRINLRAAAQLKGPKPQGDNRSGKRRPCRMHEAEPLPEPLLAMWPTKGRTSLAVLVLFPWGRFIGPWREKDWGRRAWFRAGQRDGRRI